MKNQLHNLPAANKQAQAHLHQAVLQQQAQKLQLKNGSRTKNLAVLIQQQMANTMDVIS